MGVINLRGIVAEDFCNYKKPSMFLITSQCDFKCCHEANIDESVCQNEPLIRDTVAKDYDIKVLIDMYMDNPITKAVVFGGLEPFLEFKAVKEFIHMLREGYNCYDPVIIYTGYYPNEIADEIAVLKKFDNIIVKFGRYIPNHEPHFDECLGVNLASDNQWAEVI